MVVSELLLRTARTARRGRSEEVGLTGVVGGDGRSWCRHGDEQRCGFE